MATACRRSGALCLAGLLALAGCESADILDDLPGLASLPGLDGGSDQAPEPVPDQAPEPIPEAAAAAPAGPPPSEAGGPADPEALALLPVPEGASPAAPERRALERPPQFDAPDIYMALQPDSAGTVSVIFAIDQSRDNTPSDDPAIRLTPEAGQCNPQQLRSFDFPPPYNGRPIYSRLQATQRVGARELPAFLSTAVTDEMVRQGLARTPDETRPQNMCAFLLWRRLTDAEYQAALAGQ